VVEPVDPLERRELHIFDPSPRTVAANDLGLVETDDRLRQGIVVRVADAADRGLDAGFGKLLGIADRHVLNSTIAVMNQLVDFGPRVEGLLERVEGQVASQRARHLTCPPQIDPTRLRGSRSKGGGRWAGSATPRSRSSVSSGRQTSNFGITEQTYSRWRKEYGGLRLDQAKRLKELEKENVRLKKLVADQALDNAMLKEFASGNF